MIHLVPLLLAGAPLVIHGTSPLDDSSHGDVAHGSTKGFDWIVDPGDQVLFNTDFQVLIDNRNGLIELVEDGLLLLDDVHIGEGAVVRVLGSNPFLLLATGSVQIDGTLDLSGFAGKNVQSLNLAQVPQSGGSGGPGGGAGGDGSPLTDSSSPRGGAGLGPAASSTSGGQGGESGYSGAPDRNLWRGAGGGGGRFSTQGAEDGQLGMDTTPPEFDLIYPFDEGAFGALSDEIPPVGGTAGSPVFADGDPRNDFWGFKRAVGQLIAGELGFLHAGSGGGGGGDSINSAVFPSPEFINPIGLTTHDYKGGAGGGGGGGLLVVALGPIVVGPQGSIVGDGGSGGTGESTFFIDRVGGAGGGGSGGHIVLESAERIEFAAPGDAEQFALSAQGGAGALGLPIGPNPEGTTEFNEIFDILGYPVGEGGDGSPGVIQLHVPFAPSGGQAPNLVLPPGLELKDLGSPRPHLLIPTFVPLFSSAVSLPAYEERGQNLARSTQ